jgi:hypothetical protein
MALKVLMAAMNRIAVTEKERKSVWTTGDARAFSLFTTSTLAKR